ncbi:MAG: ribosome maturation factor RimP [Thermovirgaceae bacterium]
MKDLFEERFGNEPIKRVVESLGYEFVGVERVTESGRTVFRVYIDSLGGISVADCETVSRELNRLLDRHADLLPEHFFLEVSSPGLERPLFSIDDYRKFTGRKVKVKLHEKIENRKHLTEEITGVGEATIRFGEEGKTVFEVPFEKIARARLVDDGEGISRRLVEKKQERKKRRKK